MVVETPRIVKVPAQAGAKKTVKGALSPKEIMEAIASAIRKRDLVPGERLTEQGLAEVYGVKRGPIREALKMLAAHGMVRLIPNRGAVIPKLSDSEVTAASQITGALLGLAARRAAEFGTIEQRQSLRKGLLQLSETANKGETTVDDYFRGLIPCVDVLLDAASSETLRTMFHNVAYYGPAATYSRMSVVGRRERQKRAKQWIALAEAIFSARPRDAERAAWAIQEASLVAAIQAAD